MRKAYAHWTRPSGAPAALALAVIIIILLRDQGGLTATFLSWMLIALGAALATDTPWLAAGCFTVPIINGVLHGVFSVRFREGNPGVVTGLLLLVPVGIAGYAGMAHLSTADAVGAWAIGIAVHLGLVAFGVVRLRRSRVSPQSSPA